MVLFQYKGEWTCSALGDVKSPQWLQFVKGALDRYGVGLENLNPRTQYTFVCTRKEVTPASENAIYLMNEYGGGSYSQGLQVPRPEQIVLSTKNLTDKQAMLKSRV